jgi:hypothetical protein
MSTAQDNDVVKVTIKRSGDGWKLTVIGVRPGHKEPGTFYRARSADMDKALEQLSDWRKGVTVA